MAEPVLRRRAAGNPASLSAALHPVLRRVYAQRGIGSDAELSTDLKALLPPDSLRGIGRACDVLAAALRAGDPIVVVGDYDADGATGTALGVSVLRALGAARVEYLVPSRFRQGYGLSGALAEAAHADGARLLLTVDNGIASHAGVARAHELGMRVVVSDHHLAGPTLPEADAIVNPNQPGCDFGSKHLAGVGVLFYLLSALRAQLRATGWFAARPEPNLAEALDLVAVGTVADMVRLDANNRVLVAQGLRRIRAGRARPGLRALLQVAGRDAATLGSADLGYAIGPRLNAAGRLDDMRLGIDCLLSDGEAAALELAQRLDQLNRERRGLEQQMRDEALERVESVAPGTVGVSLFDPGWHEGVVGLVAGRVKDRLHRPVVAFARSQEAGLLKGSARSIAGLHVRDLLAAVEAARPGLLLRFGGHAMAAGLTLAERDLDEFRDRFDAVCRAAAEPGLLEQVIDTDGELTEGELSLETAQALAQAGPWGQGFAEPLFQGRFGIEQARVIGERHARYRLRLPDGRALDAVHFGGGAGLLSGRAMECTYRLMVNRWQGSERLELALEWVCAAPD